MFDKEILKTTCPRDCYDACGISVIKRKGRVTKIVGDPDHYVSRGALCGKCALAYNGIFLDSKARLTQPLKRIGAKGEGRFAPVSWDEAIGGIATRLKEIIGTGPATRIVHAHYTGTCAVIAGNFPMRFFYRLGAQEVEPDTVCNMAGHVALGYVIGSSAIGFDPRTAKDSSCILVWGANPSASAPHAHKHWLKETPAKVIVVDPVRHPTAEAADLHLQPFPGTDAALAFAMMHVLTRDGRIDRAFIDKATIGWNELEPRLEHYTPSWGEAMTGVPAAQIEAAAKLYGAGPSLLWLGQALQRQQKGGNIIRAVSLLPAITGNYAKPGAGLLYLNGKKRKGVDMGYVTGASLNTGVPTFSQMDLAARLEDKTRSAAFFCWNINPAASSPEQKRLHNALKREDLLNVVADIFPTDTTDFADYVLPAASFLEHDDLVSGYFNMSFSAQAKVMEPMGETLPNQEIFRRLARSMGYSEAELYESDEAIIANVMRQVGIKGSFDEFKAKGTVFPTAEPVIQFADFKFPTPSGKIEIASAQAEKDGFSRVPEPSVDDRPKDGQLRLLTPASPWLMNDSYANDAKIAKQLGAASVTLNPKDAAARGLKRGDRVRLSNPTGSLDLILAVDDVVPEGAALSYKGRWPKLEGGSRLNVNALNPGLKSDMGESSCVHGVEVTIERIGAI
ncbi:MAG: dehydrogenase [Alphaproteobacteria bacterium]|nr:dehydrogenase [Alphaproteobacteria bacterium]